MHFAKKYETRYTQRKEIENITKSESFQKDDPSQQSDQNIKIEKFELKKAKSEE